MFPAPAGMSPNRRRLGQPISNVPRTCGDEPYKLAVYFTAVVCSPHLRG